MSEKIWIGQITDPNYDVENPYQEFGMPSPYIRREFFLSAIDPEATLTIATLGIALVYINGALVTDHFMAPEADENRKRVSSHTYPIAPYLRKGKNAIGIVLGDGWYASFLSVECRNIFGHYPLKTWYRIQNGTETLESDGSETWSTGEIVYADNQNGQKIDHRLDIGDFSSPDFDASSFRKVSTYHVALEVTPSDLPPVKAIRSEKGKILFSSRDCVRFDFGQNCAAVLKVVVQGKEGTVLRLRHAERLQDNGELYTENLRKARAEDYLILSGKGEETFLPRFTFHGFRYAEIQIQGDASLLSVEQIAISSSLQDVGTFLPDNPLVSQLDRNITWGMRSNFLALPTDCPQRDERLGWTGDAQIFFSAAAYRQNVNAFYRHYLQTIRDSADLFGNGIPVLTPYVLQETLATGYPGWSDAIILIPYQHYLFYGEKDVLEENFPYMERFLSFMEKFRRGKDGLWKETSFGDWLGVMETLPNEVYNALYLAYDVSLLSKISAVLGKEEEARRYHQKFKEYRQVFRDAYLHEDGTIEGDTQSAYVLAYAFGLIDAAETKGNLVRKIREFGHLTTGFHSTKHLLKVLVELGETKLAYELLNRKEFPSWGYMIENGATTIWERWDSYKKGEGFNDVGMNSFNHYSLGAVGEWFYSTIAGIAPCFDEPGFAKVRVAPRFDPSIPSCKTTFISPHGTIKATHAFTKDGIFYEISTDGDSRFEFDFANHILKEGHKEHVWSFLLEKSSE